MPREQSTCDFCGALFTPSHSHGQRFCSKTCMGRGMRAANSPHWQGGDVELICANCGKTFTRGRNSIRPGTKNVYCSKACRNAHMVGEDAALWRGGRTIDADGYVRLYRPDHPRAFANGHVHEHVVVAMETLGRDLESGEVVHHIDGDKANNAPDNLLVLPSQSEHKRLHHRLSRSKKAT